MSTTVPEPDPAELPPDPDTLPDPAQVGTVAFGLDVAERAVATYLETFVSLLLVANAVGIPTVTAAAVAAAPAGLSIIKAGISRFLDRLSSTRRQAGFLADLAERTVATYLESVVAFLAVADQLDVSTGTAAAVAAIPAALSVVKGCIARFLGDRESAALIPRSLTG